MAWSYESYAAKQAAEFLAHAATIEGMLPFRIHACLKAGLEPSTDKALQAFVSAAAVLRAEAMRLKRSAAEWAQTDSDDEAGDN